MKRSSGNSASNVFSFASIFLCALLFAQLSQASVLNRKAVLERVKAIEASYGSERTKIYLDGKGNEEEPGVFVGEAVKFRLTSDDARHYLMVLVDPRGQASVIFPDLALEETPKKYKSFEYPPLGTGDVVQEKPVGIQTVVLLATDKPLSAESLGFSSNSDLHVVGDNVEVVGDFVARINSLLSGAIADAAVYTYFVDADVQYGTRAVRREIKRRKEQIDILEAQRAQQTGLNQSGSQEQSERVLRVQSESLSVHDIRFEFNSDVLTPTGRIQLDIFGDQLEQLLLEDPSIVVTLEGHTDSTGTTAYNQSLSERRAASARRHLLRNFDMPAGNVMARGLGESTPIESNDSAQTRAKNRRVEISLGR